MTVDWDMYVDYIRVTGSSNFKNGLIFNINDLKSDLKAFLYSYKFEIYEILEVKYFP